jgi:hypothetical protein
MSQNDLDNALAPDEEAAIRHAFSRTNLPGLVLILVGALNLYASSEVLVRAFQYLDTPAAKIVEEFKEASDGRFPPPGDPEEWKSYFVITAFVLGSLGVGSAILTITAGMFMRTLRHYRVVVAGAVVVLVPLVSWMACFGLGLAVGFWALYVLLQPDVKAAFI